jgi:hypothetical protein
MEPNPDTDNLSVYDDYWKLLDEKYAMWNNPDKNLDKEAIHSYTRGLVNESISQDSLFNILGYIVLQLRDGHTWIDDYYRDSSIYYDIEAIGEPNYDQEIVDNVYLKNDYKTIGKKEKLKYKLLENGQIGYIQIEIWTDTYEDKDIDKVLNYMSSTKGIVLDVRDNPGGDPFMAVLVARHFAAEEHYVGSEMFKTGPGPDDFSENKLYVTPAKGIIYTKPVKILTNRLCFSATTSFIYYLNPLPNVTFIGARTGGGSGGTADGYLTNGWHWQMSTTEFIDWEGRHLDNGFDPDIEVALDTTDRTQDEIIERAISEILNR